MAMDTADDTVALGKNVVDGGVAVVDGVGKEVGGLLGDVIVRTVVEPLSQEAAAPPTKPPPDGPSVERVDAARQLLERFEQVAEAEANKEEEQEPADDEADSFVGETGEALSRLFHSGTSAVSESLSTMEYVTGRVLDSATKSGVGVVRHTLGEDTGRLVERGVGVGRTGLKTVATVKSFGAKKALKIAQSSAQKEIVGKVVKKQSSKKDGHKK